MVFPRALMTPIKVPAKLFAMSNMALCSPEYINPLHPTATVNRTIAAEGWSPTNEAPNHEYDLSEPKDSFNSLPKRAMAGPAVAIVFAIFLNQVLDKVSFLMAASTVMELKIETIHMAKYGSPLKNPLRCEFYFICLNQQAISPLI